MADYDTWRQCNGEQNDDNEDDEEDDNEDDRKIDLALASASSGSGWSPAVAAPVLHNKLLNCSIDTKALLSEPILF